MSITRAFLAIACFILALITGFRTGATINPVEKVMKRSVEIDSTPGVPIPANDQFNWLFIGVDDVQNKDAKLQSIWILAFPKSSNRLNLIPVFPSEDNPVQNLILSEAFHLNNGHPSQEFWDAMKETDTWWTDHIIREKSEIIMLIDSLGGIEVNGEYFNGDQALSKIPRWRNDPQNAVRQQKMIFEGICGQISKIHSLGTKSEIFLGSMNLSQNTAAFIRQWDAMILANKSLDCNFPTFVEIPVSPALVLP
jgi:hypothetical protein